MNYCFDIDGTLCTNTNGEYGKAEPYPEVIARINSLFEDGHRILLYTARGSTTGMDWREMTEKQMQSWGVRYHELRLGKPQADLYIDDRAMSLTEWTKSQGDKASSTRMDRIDGRRSVLAEAAYLDTTYSPALAPYGEYPYLLARWLLENVYKSPGNLLDIGCERGEHLQAFSRLGCDVVGVDISPRAPELAKGFRVTIVDLEQEELPFPSGSFDYVFCKSVIEHMRRPSRLLSQALRVLRPGGQAVIMTPSWEHTYWGPFYIDHTHVTPFTASSLTTALNIAGFQSATASYFYQLPFLWRYPFLKPLVRFIAALPLSYRPYRPAPWPDTLNKLVRFSKEVMLLGVARKEAEGHDL